MDPQQQQQPQEARVGFLTVKTSLMNLKSGSSQPCTLRETDVPNGELCYEIEREVKFTVFANVHKGAFLAVFIERYHDDPAVVLPLVLDDVAYKLRYPFIPDETVHSPGQMFSSSVSFSLVPYYLPMSGCTPEHHKLINFAHVKFVLVDNDHPVAGIRFFTKTLFCRDLYFGPVPKECRHLFPSSESSSESLESAKEQQMQQQQQEDISSVEPNNDLSHSMNDASLSNISRCFSLLTSH